jgi:hypothetical protein
MSSEHKMMATMIIIHAGELACGDRRNLVAGALAAFIESSSSSWRDGGRIVWS